MPNSRVVKPLFKNPARSPEGVGTTLREDIKGKFGQFDPSQWQRAWDDFLDYKVGVDLSTSNQYTVTLTGTGTAVISANEGGTVSIVNSAANNDSTTISRVAGYTLATNRSLIFDAKWQVDDATNAHVAAGIVVAGGVPNSYTDGITIRKPAAGTTFLFEVKKNGATTISQTISLTCPATTQINTGFSYKGVTQQVAGVTNFEFVAQIDLNDGNGPRQFSMLVPSTSMPTVALGVMLGVANGTAAARTVIADYIFAAKDRFYA